MLFNCVVPCIEELFQCLYTYEPTPFPLTGRRAFPASLPGAGEVPGLGSAWFSGCGLSGWAALPHGAWLGEELQVLKGQRKGGREVTKVKMSKHFPAHMYWAIEYFLCPVLSLFPSLPPHCSSHHSLSTPYPLVSSTLLYFPPTFPLYSLVLSVLTASLSPRYLWRLPLTTTSSSCLTLSSSLWDTPSWPVCRPSMPSSQMPRSHSPFAPSLWRRLARWTRNMQRLQNRSLKWVGEMCEEVKLYDSYTCSDGWRYIDL